MPEEEIRVTFGIKELLGSIDVRLASIDLKLDSKADISDMKLLADRQTAQSERMGGIEKRLEIHSTVLADRDRQKQATFSRTEKSIALLIALFAVVIPLITQRGGI